MLSATSFLSGAYSRTKCRSSSVDLETDSLCSTLTSDATEDDTSSSEKIMGDYGEYLLCPVCKELITHPVLLPCQHSVCYGCARSQILAADAEEISTICEESPSTPRRTRTNTPASHHANHRKRLESTPSESSVLSCASSKRDSGIETSPTHGSSLTKGFSFVSTASSTCSSGSNEHGQHPDQDEVESPISRTEKNASATKGKAKNLKGRRIMPKFHSSPRLQHSNGRTGSANTPSSAVNGEGGHEHASTPRSAQLAVSNGDPCSPVVFTTDDMLHFEASQGKIVDQTPTKGEDPDSCCHGETPNAAGAKQRKKSLTKPTRKNSKLNGTPSLTELVGVGHNLSRSPSSISSSSIKSSKGMRRANSTSTISRSPSVRSVQRGADVVKRSRVKAIYCVSCETDVELGKLGIKGLFRNFQLEGIVERFRAKAKAKVAIRCGYCKPPASDATKSCLDCKLSYCNQCYKNVHVWGTKKAQHDFIGPTNNFSRPKVMLCPEHGTEPVNMYCSQCQHSVCRACKSRGGAHANHHIISVKNAYKESKDRLYALMDVLRNKKDSMEGAIMDMECNIKSFEDEEGMVRDEIHTAIDEMHKLLEQKRTQLLEKADVFARGKENQMRQDLQRMKSNAMYSSVMAFAEEVLLETDPAYFLQTIKMVEMRVQEAIEHMTRRPASLVDNQDIPVLGAQNGERRAMLPLYLDLGPPKTAVDSLDFTKAPGVPVVRDQYGNEDSYEMQSPDSFDAVWSLGKNERADCFQIHYWRDEDDSEGAFETHDVKGADFSIPRTSKLAHGSGDFFVRVRAANRVGFGPWSENAKISSRRLRRENFKLTNAEGCGLLKITRRGAEAYRKVLDESISEEKFSFLLGDVWLDGVGSYFEISASGGTDFHFLVGVASHEFDSDEADSVISSLDQNRSAILYCGSKDCYVVDEDAATDLHSILKGRSGQSKSVNVPSDFRHADSAKRQSGFSPLKPLKQLKNSLMRRSSFNGPIRSVKVKSRQRTTNNDDSYFRSLDNPGIRSPGLWKSSSVTSLPSVLRAQSPVSDQLSRSSSQWNIRSHVGRRCFRIGVEMSPLEDERFNVQFLNMSAPTPFTLASVSVEKRGQFQPVLAMAGNGKIAVV